MMIETLKEKRRPPATTRATRRMLIIRVSNSLLRSGRPRLDEPRAPPRLSPLPRRSRRGPRVSVGVAAAASATTASATGAPSTFISFSVVISAIKLHCESALAYCLCKSGNPASIAEAAAVEHYCFDTCCENLLCQIFAELASCVCLLCLHTLGATSSKSLACLIVDNLRMQVTVRLVDCKARALCGARNMRTDACMAAVRLIVFVIVLDCI
jgi:hypothetical protein